MSLLVIFNNTIKFDQLLKSMDYIFFEAIYLDKTKRHLDEAEMFLKTVTRSKICAAICGPILEFL
jgi:hypothetical protein